DQIGLVHMVGVPRWLYVDDGWPHGRYAGIPAALVAQASVSYDGLRGRGGQLFWVESRPGQDGRRTLVRWSGAGGVQDATPAGFDVGNDIHAYGGGVYEVVSAAAVCACDASGGVRCIEPGGVRHLAGGDRSGQYGDL